MPQMSRDIPVSQGRRIEAPLCDRPITMKSSHPAGVRIVWIERRGCGKISLRRSTMKFSKPRDKIIVPVILVLVLSFALAPQFYLRLFYTLPTIFEGDIYADWMSAGPDVGEKAPKIVGKSLDGEVIRLSDYRGKVVFLNFWADS